MSKTLSNARDRDELLSRLDRLTPNAHPAWGTMTALQMLAHVADWMLMASGDLATGARQSLLQYAPLKQIAIYWLPFPRGVPTAPELLKRKPSEWATERTLVRERVQSFGIALKSPSPKHPVFGEMTPRAWGVFGYRHMDHHLRQFGV
jgi:hypothetical protein